MLFPSLPFESGRTCHEVFVRHVVVMPPAKEARRCEERHGMSVFVFPNRGVGVRKQSGGKKRSTTGGELDDKLEVP